MPAVFKLGTRSKERLQGIHVDLIRLAEVAIECTPLDFTITCGLRTEELQRVMVASGASQTMASKHLTGLAFDFMPYVNGYAREEWPLYYPIAETFVEVAREIGIQIIWGGAWNVALGAVASPNRAIEAQGIYIKSRTATGKSLFFDGPHIELYQPSGVV